MPARRPSLSRSAGRRGLLPALLLAGLALAAPRAHAQIVREKPAQIKAANRRALREARQTDVPYKDSHLAVSRERLKRGQSTPNLPEGSDELRYKAGPAPSVKPPGVLGLRRKRVSNVMREEHRVVPRKSGKDEAKKK